MGQSNENHLDMGWDCSAGFYCVCELSMVPLGSGSGHEHTANSLDLGNCLLRLRVGCLYCLGSWLVASKEEKLRLHNLREEEKRAAFFYLSLNRRIAI